MEIVIYSIGSLILGILIGRRKKSEKSEKYTTKYRIVNENVPNVGIKYAIQKSSNTRMLGEVWTFVQKGDSYVYYNNINKAEEGIEELKKLEKNY